MIKYWIPLGIQYQEKEDNIMPEIDVEVILRNIENIKRSVEFIEQQIDGKRIDPYKRREAILRQIYIRKAVTKNALLELMKAEGTQPQWIGMQIKAGYLVKTATPNGIRYSVTEKALSEYQWDKSPTEVT
jgi:hypothetical protein